MWLMNIFLYCGLFGACSGICNLLDLSTKIMNIVDSDLYSHMEQPGNGTTLVNASIIVYEIIQIDEISKQMELLVSLWMSWDDPRLSVSVDDCTDETVDVLESSLWSPNLLVVNAFSASIYESPSLVSISTVTSTGHIFSRINMKLSIPCLMNYRRFPFDRVSCQLVLTTWTNPNLVLVQWWDERAMRLGFTNLATHEAIKYSYKDLSSAEHGGMWQNTIYLNRRYVYYVLVVFVPSALVVFITYAAFWLEFGNIRISLCLTALISISFMFGGVSGSLPKVGYMKGIDLWILGCLIFAAIPQTHYTVFVFLCRRAGGWDEPLPWTKMNRLKKSHDEKEAAIKKEKGEGNKDDPDPEIAKSLNPAFGKPLGDALFNDSEIEIVSFTRITGTITPGKLKRGAFDPEKLSKTYEEAKSAKKSNEEDETSDLGSMTSSNGNKTEEKNKTWSDTPTVKQIGKQADRILRVMHISGFVLFMAVYFGFYLQNVDLPKEDGQMYNPVYDIYFKSLKTYYDEFFYNNDRHAQLKIPPD